MSEIVELTGKYPNIGNVFAKAQQGFPTNLASRHEHLMRELDAAWGTAEGVRLLDELMFSDRPDRNGFTYDVMMELFALKGHHDRLYPQFVGNQFDPFAAVKLVEEGGNPAPKAPRRAASTAPGAVRPVASSAKPAAPRQAAVADAGGLLRRWRALRRTPAGRKSSALTSCATC